jgi:hypothetical protein
MEYPVREYQSREYIESIRLESGLYVCMCVHIVYYSVFSVCSV